MKRLALLIIISFLTIRCAVSQTNVLAPNYKVIDLGWNGYGDYTRSIVLLHEVYNGSLINKNYAIGTIKAMRGNAWAFDRTDVAQINTSSAYSNTNGSVISLTTWDVKWILKTAIYNGKKYIALEVPYSAAYHDWGYQFVGWTNSTGENMKCVSYEVNGQPVNQNIISNIENFNPTISEFHDVNKMELTGFLHLGKQEAPANTVGEIQRLSLQPFGHTGGPWNFFCRDIQGSAYMDIRYGNLTGLTMHNSGNVGIGTTTPQNKLDVNGTIRAKEVKVETGWADFVFAPTYKLRPLSEVEQFIKTNDHLPEIPKADEVQQNGINLGEMQTKLLQKVEELTLYSIEQEKANAALQQQLTIQAHENHELKEEMKELKKLLMEKLK